MDSKSQYDIGRNIRAVRTQLKLTQQQLADSCGLTKSMISKVESGAVVPALATLTKIAQAMHVKVSRLIEPEDQQPSVWTVNPFANPAQFITTSMGYSIYNPAAGLDDKMIQPILINAEENEVRPHLLSHPGEEYIFIFSGEMVFEVNGTTYLLRRGDSLFFDGTQLHGIHSVNGSVQYVNIFVGHHYEAPSAEN